MNTNTNLESDVVNNIRDIPYLYKCANAFSGTPNGDLLKSYLLQRCRRADPNSTPTAPSQSARCPKCSILYSESSSNTFRIQPSKKNGRFLRRLISRQKEKITGFQKKVLKKSRQFIFNTLQVTCGTCKFTAKTITKKFRTLQIENVQTPTVIINKENSNQKKKKKKKDQFCGLNQDAVASTWNPNLIVINCEDQSPAVAMKKQKPFTRAQKLQADLNTSIIDLT